MNTQQFIDALRIVVRDAAVNGTLSVLQKPPGRKPRTEWAAMAEWFRTLNDTDRDMVLHVIRFAVDQSVFDLLSVLDGVSSIEDAPHKGRLELRYVSASSESLLNDSAKEPLHDIFNRPSVAKSQASTLDT